MKEKWLKYPYPTKGGSSYFNPLCPQHPRHGGPIPHSHALAWNSTIVNSPLGNNFLFLCNHFGIPFLISYYCHEQILCFFCFLEMDPFPKQFCSWSTSLVSLACFERSRFPTLLPSQVNYWSWSSKLCEQIDLQESDKNIFSRRVFKIIF